MTAGSGKPSLIIAVDGPSGAGKSTASRMIAERMELTYIDTGAMYRAVALKSRNEGVDPEDDAGLGEVARNSDISFKIVAGENRTFLDGSDVSEDIRRPEISMLTSKVSSVPEVRSALVALQRKIGEDGGVIMDGRDIGTVVFPDADIKFFLDADLEERGKRRYLEMSGKRQDLPDISTTTRELAERDRADSERPESPLKRADDAVCIDTTDLSPAEVVEKMEGIIFDRVGRWCR